jgi:hypothetical protein
MSKKRRTYQPRIVGGKVMMPADLKRLHKYMLDIEHIDHIRMRCEPWSKVNGPSLRISCHRSRNTNLMRSVRWLGDRRAGGGGNPGGRDNFGCATGAPKPERVAKR